MNAAVLARPAKKKRAEKNPGRPGFSDGVFSINFIRNEFLPVCTRRAIVYGASAYLALNLVWGVSLLADAFATRMKISSVENQLRRGQTPGLTPSESNSEMSALYEHAIQDLGQMNSVTSLMRRRFPGAGKLDALSQTLPARTWITEISANRDARMLTFHAMYLLDPAKPYELPTKGWVQALKADPNFSRGLKRLELGNSFQKSQGSAELFSFELNAEWAPAGEP